MAENNSTEKLRLFVAIAVPDAIREEMIRVQHQLQPLAPRGVVRWTKPEQFHLTLRFLGDVSSDCLAALQESVRAVCSGEPALHLQAQGVGFFPKARSPRVIWIGITDGENRLVDFQRKIEDAVQPFSAGPGGERFAGHVTLGRFKQSKWLDINSLTARADTMKDSTFGEWTVREVEIIRSELLATGSRYTQLAAIRLGTGIAFQ
ncbi:MAG TPA: RNA 2',3'-cyclic phosphodiesterase [Candidatus Limnocylindrales bacterium]|nr:RNA 2',3'-cyclic phosphodiesterase [Candidatus Limnocylindrales bacterium]